MLLERERLLKWFLTLGWTRKGPWLTGFVEFDSSTLEAEYCDSKDSSRGSTDCESNGPVLCGLRPGVVVAVVR